MPETFFSNLNEYLSFILSKKEIGRAAPDGSWFATLEKKEDKLTYSLTWKDGRYVSDHIRLFRPTEANLQLFNAGCKEMARVFKNYIETNDLDQIPNESVFGKLSFDSPENSAIENTPISQAGATRKYFPMVSNAQLVRRYDGGVYKLALLTEVECLGIIRCDHLLAVCKKGDDDPLYMVAAEVNNLRKPWDVTGTHFLCCYTGVEHTNLGCSDKWKDLSHFEEEALRIVSKDFDIQIALIP